MSAMRPELWARLEPRLDELLTLAPLERARRLDEIAANDPDTARELRELLSAGDDASRAGFLGKSVAPALLAPTAGAGDVLGPWTLVQPIGEGGMGSVWRARRSDGRFEGEAAVKLLKSGLFDAAAQERFRREGAILARLRHPSIAQLLDAGITAKGQPYLVLELVQGERIDRWCEAHAARHTPADRALPAGARGGGRGARPARHPSRPEAFQHPGRRERAREAARLRHRPPAAGPGRRRGDRADARRRARADAAVRGARAVRRRRARHGDRRVRARHRPVRAAHESASERARARQQIARVPARRGRGPLQAGQRARARRAARAARRSRQHPAQGAGCAAGRALRERRRVRRRPAAPPEPPAGGGPARHARLPDGQVRAPQSRRRRGGGGGGRGARRRPGGDAVDGRRGQPPARPRARRSEACAPGRGTGPRVPAPDGRAGRACRCAGGRGREPGGRARASRPSAPSASRSAPIVPPAKPGSHRPRRRTSARARWPRPRRRASRPSGPRPCRAS